MNSEVSATGMKVQAKSDSSLLISINKQPANATVDVMDTKYSELYQSDLNKSVKLVPTTYQDNVYKAATNAGTTIDQTTGTLKDGYSLAEVENWKIINPTGAANYRDYIFMIADAGSAESPMNLQVDVNFATSKVSGDGTDNSTIEALSVDIWYKLNVTEALILTDVNPDDAVDPRATLDDFTYANKMNYIGDKTSPATSNVVIDTTTTGIPQVNNGWICVVARVYFDGDLTYQEASDAVGTEGDPNYKPAKPEIKYVRSSLVDTRDTEIELTFTAVAKPAGN